MRAGAFDIPLDPGVPPVADAAAKKLFGFSPESEPLMEEYMQRVHPADRQRVREVIQQSVRNRTGHEVEFRVPRPDGAELWVTSRSEPVLDPTGRTVGLHGLLLDISEQKRAEQALQAANRRLQATIDSISDGLLVLDREWRSTYFSEQAARIIGLRPEDLIGRVLWDVFPHAKGTKFYECYHRAVQTQKPQHFEEFYPGPLNQWFECHCYPNEEGLTVYFHDITERKKGEKALRTSEERLRLALDTGEMGTFVWYPLEDRGEPDARFLHLLGLPGNSGLSLHSDLGRVLHPADRERFAQALARAIHPACSGWLKEDLRVMPATGPARWVSIAARTYFDSAQQPREVVGLVTDITGHKEFQAALQHLVAERTARLEELVGELEHFSYSITHDMRAPLRAMRGYAEVITEMSADWADPELKRFLRQIVSAAERMDLLITDALNYSKTLREEVPVAPVDTDKLLRGLLETYPQFLVNRAHIRVEGSLPTVMGNEAALTQCFSNLLGNAFKFVPPGQPPQVRVWAEQVPLSSPEAATDALMSRIWVEDKGIGIPEHMLPRIFNMFTRGPGNYEGTGIGLALVRKVVQRMGGAVGVESESGKGSRFWVQLRSAAQP